MSEPITATERESVLYEKIAESVDTRIEELVTKLKRDSDPVETATIRGGIKELEALKKRWTATPIPIQKHKPDPYL
jgi:hypothetical protein